MAPLFRPGVGEHTSPAWCLCLLLACVPLCGVAGEIDAGGASRDEQPPPMPAHAVPPLGDECRDIRNPRIDGMGRWACAVAVGAAGERDTAVDARGNTASH
ncbi:hypothetical protein M2650_03135 [Luteimonas sp. SX5]|uniref:Uncharacterized protein n=1 Tax=Luteimonas galliterrae TaxID=2940486 RepID=A0ABT0MG51_9GAMM|nr:hypothetical protein [Luteimonas galliterrae]MCL1633638.1 hypothetical protein [Luteimonas galliterrae]